MPMFVVELAYRLEAFGHVYIDAENEEEAEAIVEARVKEMKDPDIFEAYVGDMDVESNETRVVAIYAP